MAPEFSRVTCLNLRDFRIAFSAEEKALFLTAVLIQTHNA